ncbi:hypothetical protein [Vibrio sp. V39_P1S14PM300]|uniref:hypothetical protein n=1 Tax=Vibrio sp. V39_P1S14PM300 TaxID=1938690 RepID=UPI001372C0AF|nr:hypothetical protein [Vibrio sp. V39_P1S14PM300]NAX21265.1 hypothetical protein [Vibrio sp. V39_P1S14PM300]
MDTETKFTLSVGYQPLEVGSIRPHDTAIERSHRLQCVDKLKREFANHCTELTQKHDFCNAFVPSNISMQRRGSDMVDALPDFETVTTVVTASAPVLYLVRGVVTEFIRAKSAKIIEIEIEDKDGKRTKFSSRGENMEDFEKMVRRFEKETDKNSSKDSDKQTRDT